MKRCPECNSEWPDGTRFCGKCGHTFIVNTELPTTRSSSTGEGIQAPAGLATLPSQPPPIGTDSNWVQQNQNFHTPTPPPPPQTGGQFLPNQPLLSKEEQEQERRRRAMLGLPLIGGL